MKKKKKKKTERNSRLVVLKLVPGIEHMLFLKKKIEPVPVSPVPFLSESR